MANHLEKNNIVPLRKNEFLDGTSINIQSGDYLGFIAKILFLLVFLLVKTCGHRGTRSSPTVFEGVWKPMAGWQRTVFVFVPCQSSAAARTSGEDGSLAWLPLAALPGFPLCQ